MNEDQKNVECLKAYLALNYGVAKECEKQIKEQPDSALIFEVIKDLVQKPIDFILNNSSLTLDDVKKLDQDLLNKKYGKYLNKPFIFGGKHAI